VNSLKRKKHHNSHLQNVFNKYGIDQFKCYVLEVCDNYIERETHYIKCLKPNMNIEQDPVNRKKSEETKRKLSIANMGKNIGSANPVAKPIHQYDIDGNYIKSYDTVKEASIAVGLNYKTIHKNSVKNTKTLGGYMWSFKKVSKLKTKSPKKPSNVKYKKVILVSEKETKTVKSVAAAAELLNVTVQSIHQAAKKNKTCKGYQIKLN
jgi:group I intron endonuclease